MLRLCVDEIVRPGGHRADIYSQITLDAGRAQRCQPLAIGRTNDTLGIAVADGVARNNWYRWAGIFSHHVSCQPIGGSELASRPQNTTHGCSFVTDCLEGWCTYSSSCNPHLGACYSMVEYDSVNSQPLWCCDFAHEVAVKATVAKVLVWDEATPSPPL